MKRFGNQRGQAGLLVVLTLTIMGVLGLSVVSQSVTELRLSGVEEEAAEAFKAAEAGVEEGLRLLTGTSGEFDGSSFNVVVEQSGGTGFLSESSLAVGEVVEISLGVGVKPASVNIYWGDNGNSAESPTGAIEVLKYQVFPADDYRVVHSGYDPNAGRIGNNNFSAATVNPPAYLGVSFGASTNVALVSEDRYLRIRIFYNNARLAVEPIGGTLSDLQTKVVSEGSTDQGVVRKIEVTRTNPGLPNIFDAAIYSGGSLVQQ